VAYEPKNRKKLSDTDLLIRGANMAASGIQEGYTPEQTLDMLMKYFQRQGVADVQEYSQKSLQSAYESAPETAEIANQKKIEVEKALREVNKGIKTGNVRNLERIQEIENIVGRDQSDFQQFGGADVVTGRTRDYGADRAGRIEAGLIPRSEMSDIELSISNEARGRAPSGAGGVRDALNRLQAKIAEVGYDALPPETREVERRLIDSLGYGPEQRAAERSLARDIVIRERPMFSDEARRRSDLKAAEEAASYGWIEGGRGTAADEALANIGRITRLGQVKAKAPYSVIPNSDVSNFGNAEWQGIPGGNETTGYYVDPRTGQPVLVSEPVLSGISGVNTPNSAQLLNAPIGPNRYHVSQGTLDWITQNLPGDSRDDSGGMQKGKFGQVDISRTTADFSARLQDLGNKNRKLYPGLAGVSSNVRSIGEFDRAINQVINQRSSSTGRFFIPDPLTRKQTLVANPGPSDVLRLLDMSSTEEDKLKNALMQLTLAQENQRKADYIAKDFEGFRRELQPITTATIFSDNAEALDSSRGTAEIAFIGKDTTLKNSNRTVRGLLNTFKDDPQVSTPVMGATTDRWGGNPPITRQLAGGLDPTEIRWQAEQRAGRNQKLRPNPDKKAKQKFLSVKGEILGSDANRSLEFASKESIEKLEQLRDYQVDNALLRQAEISRQRASGQSADFLIHNPKGRQGRPLPTRIRTSPAMGFVPDMNEGFDYESWKRRQAAPKQQVAPKSTAAIADEAYSRLIKRVGEKQQQTETATPPPPNKPPTRTAVGASSQPPWHRGKKRYMAAGAAGLGTLGLLANEQNRRQDQEEMVRY